MKPKAKKRIIYIGVGTWQTGVFVMLNCPKEDAGKLYNKECAPDINWEFSKDDPMACTLTTKFSRGSVIWFKLSTPKITTIQHECLHVAWQMIESAGCPVNTETSEAVAYLQEYLVYRIAQQILSKNVCKHL